MDPGNGSSASKVCRQEFQPQARFNLVVSAHTLILTLHRTMSKEIHEHQKQQQHDEQKFLTINRTPSSVTRANVAKMTASTAAAAASRTPKPSYSAPDGGERQEEEKSLNFDYMRPSRARKVGAPPPPPRIRKTKQQPYNHASVDTVNQQQQQQQQLQQHRQHQYSSVAPVSMNKTRGTHFSLSSLSSEQLYDLSH
jgi:hypothetical protein